MRLLSDRVALEKNVLLFLELQMTIQWINLKYEYITNTIVHFSPVTHVLRSLLYWF